MDITIYTRFINNRIEIRWPELRTLQQGALPNGGRFLLGFTLQTPTLFDTGIGQALIYYEGKKSLWVPWGIVCNAVTPLPMTVRKPGEIVFPKVLPEAPLPEKSYPLFPIRMPRRFFIPSPIPDWRLRADFTMIPKRGSKRRKNDIF